MGYVALSRVRALENIYLAGINRMALQMSSDAQQIDEFLRAESFKAEKEFAHFDA
jgi:hypothetical protein